MSANAGRLWRILTDIRQLPSFELLDIWTLIVTARLTFFKRSALPQRLLGICIGYMDITLRNCKMLIARELHDIADIENPVRDISRTRTAMTLTIFHLRNLNAVITGHCTLVVHAKRLAFPHNDYCQSCNNEKQEETL